MNELAPHTRFFRTADFYRVIVVVLCFFASIPSAWAIEDPGKELGEVGIVTQLGTKVDFTIPFTNSDGKTVTLGEIAGDRPLIVVPAYYRCPRMCGLVVAGVISLINQLDLELGSDYRVVTVSIDPSETFDKAAAAKRRQVGELKTPKNGEVGWSFLVGSEENVTALMKSIGFKYIKDKDEYAHGSAIMILTAHGEISQYFTGIDYSPSDARLALVEASKGRIGSAIDHIFLFCFRYDHAQGKYTLAVVNLVRVIGLATLVLLVGLIFVLLRSRKSVAPL